MTRQLHQKSAILSEYQQIRRQILDAALKLSAEQQIQPFVGVWTIKELLAHLAGWDRTNEEAALQIASGGPPGFFAAYDKNWQTYNAQLVAKYGQGTFDEILTRVLETHESLIATLESISEKAFSQTVRLPNRKTTASIARLIKAETRDETEHLEQIRSFFG